MEVYVDYLNKKVVEKNKIPFDMGQNLTNQIKVYVKNDITKTFYVQLEFITPDGRKPQLFTADTLASGETQLQTIDDVEYNYYCFTLPNAVTKVSGRLQITGFICFTDTDGNTTSRGLLFNTVNDIKKTVGYTDDTILMVSENADGEQLIEDFKTFINKYVSLLAAKVNTADLLGGVLEPFKNLEVTNSVKSGDIYTTTIYGAPNDDAYIDFVKDQTTGRGKIVFETTGDYREVYIGGWKIATEPWTESYIAALTSHSTSVFDFTCSSRFKVTHGNTSFSMSTNDDDVEEIQINAGSEGYIDFVGREAHNGTASFFKEVTVPTPVNTMNPVTKKYADEKFATIVDFTTHVASYNDFYTWVHTILNSTDTSLDQLSEIVAYIKNHSTEIADLTSNKVKYSDIVDNLVTALADKPLSAKQGVNIKAMIDAINTNLESIYTKTEIDTLLMKLQAEIENEIPTELTKAEYNAILEVFD